MTLLHPKTAEAPVEASQTEALIKEARRLRRRRWSIGLLVLALIGAGIGWAARCKRKRSVHPSEADDHDTTSSACIRPGLPEGPYANLTVAGPLAVALNGALYVADVNRSRYWFASPTDAFESLPATARKGTRVTAGQAIDAEFLDIEDMAVGPDGSLYVVDGDRVRVVSPERGDLDRGWHPWHAHAPAMLLEHHAPPPIANGTPARSVSIDQLNSAAIALSEQGVLYISTGMQLLRLDAGKLDVITTKAVGPLYSGKPLGKLESRDRSRSTPRATSSSRAATAGRSGGSHPTGWRPRSPVECPAQRRRHVGSRTCSQRGGLWRVGREIPRGPRRPGDSLLRVPLDANLVLLAHVLRLRTRRHGVRRRDSRGSGV